MRGALTLLPFLSALAAVALAALVVVRNRRARANQLLAASLLALGLFQAGLGITMLATSVAGLFTWTRFAVGTAALLPPLWLAFVLTFGQPAGSARLARWQPALFGLCAAVPAAWTALGTDRLLTPVRFGAGGSVLVGVDSWGKAFFAVFLIGLTLVLLHMENLYRHADRGTRWRIKFLVVGVFVAFGTQIVAASYALLYGVLHPWYPTLSPLAFFLGQVLIAFSLVRHRLLDVDVFISRYVVYRSFTLTLVGGYLVALGATAELFWWLNIRLDLLTGIVLGSLGAAALALLLLSEDVRRRVQGFLHTHFYKHKYDYRVEWMEFTHRLSQVTAIPDIAAQTVQRIAEVMWVRQAAMYTETTPGRMVLAHQVEYDRLPATLDIPPSVAGQLRAAVRSPAEPDPPETMPVVPPGLDGILGGCPFGMVVPVAALDTLAGLLVVGPELSGKPFGVDDRDLLVAVAAQAGAMIVTARLAQDAAEGRELQVLARLSAFIAHDLKNSVGMLSLLADNAPSHMHKPEFQADAIRTLTEVTGRMQRLLAALRTSDQVPAGTATQANLATTVDGWLRDLKAKIPSRISLATHLEPTPAVAMDSEQLRVVLMNLVLNAIDAIPGEGRITVETHSDDGWAALVVTDTGKGMSAAFVRDRLFRPFQTTKPNGLGIGLYQCRHIVQALGGELTVDSREGGGTRMIVRLPRASVCTQSQVLPCNAPR